MFRPEGISASGIVLIMLMTAVVLGQQPRSRQTPSQVPPARPSPRAAPPPSAAAPQQEIPTEATLGVSIYPGSQFVASYDAGRGQRYFLFGSTASFNQVVAYYRTTLKQKGDLVFDAPATHMFEIGKFREETMAFPPGVTIKDYTWGGSEGFLNPRRGAQPARYPTIIQVVPALAGDLR